MQMVELALLTHTIETTTFVFVRQASLGKTVTVSSAAHRSVASLNASNVCGV